MEQNRKVNVTKTFLPPMEEYNKYLEEIWSRDQLTNQGPILKAFESQISKYLGIENFHFVTNGTLALQIAIKALNIDEGEIITTPFSYVATTSAILWQNCEPVFVDINPENLCIDADKIEEAITDSTKAILPVHVFGIPCEIEKIEKIAKKHKIPVIYDGAHAFGVEYKDKSLLSYGDISICSFHSTKRFHTIEGGCVIANDKSVSDNLELIKRFGHNWDEHIQLGINAKASEFQAAMGLCNLKYVESNVKKRKKVTELYDALLKGSVKRPKVDTEAKYNYSYYPVILDSEEELNSVVEKLKAENIFPRRYFYPSLNTLPYLKNKQNCPISEDISKRILCLPLYEDLEEKIVEKICEIIQS